MLNMKEILEKLYRLPEQFKKEYDAGKYCAAAITYGKARIISGFMEIDVEPRDRFLSRFDEVEVIDAFKKAGWYEGEQNNADGIANRKETVRTDRYFQASYAKKRILGSGIVRRPCRDDSLLCGTGRT